MGLESVEEKIQRYEEIQKSFEESDQVIDELAKDFFIEKSLREQRLKDPDNYTIQDKINEKFELFIKAHKQSINKVKKQYDSLKKEKEEIEKDVKVKDYLDKLQKSLAYSKIKKAYQNNQISLDSFNTVIKSITKEEKTKYADFIVFNENSELLLIKRAKWEDENHGAWVLPGGHVDPEEDFETAAKRELVEEAGISVDECDNVGSYEDEKAHIEYYQTTINTRDKEPVLQWEEARDYKWVPYNEIKEEPMIFNMRSNVMKILGLVNTHKEIIKKAILDGLVPVEKIIEKSRLMHHKYLRTEIDHKGDKKYIYDDKKPEVKKEEPYTNIEKVKSYAKRVIEGIDSLKRLSQEEEQGRLLGGQRNVEATIIAGESQTTSPEYQRGDSRKEQEIRLKNYAQQEGIWIEDYRFKFGEDNYLDKGGEAEVFYNPDEGMVYKIHHFPFEQEPLKLFDRVSIHNTLFPESLYEVVGFTHKDVYGDDVFSIILKQPFVEKGNSVVSQEEMDEEMSKRGFVETDGMYINDDYAIGDLHPGNVLKDKDGNYIFIDPLIDINTPEAGYGGHRKLGEIKVSISKSILGEYGDNIIEYLSEILSKYEYKDKYKDKLERLEARRTDKQYTKEEADYVDNFIDGNHQEENSCDRCEYYRPKQKDNCQRVIGEVSHNGHCKFWEHTDVDKSIDSDIEKAKKSPVGTVVTHTDGKTMKKVSETGNPDKDWQVVKKQGNIAKQEEPSTDKTKQSEQSEAKKNFTIQELGKYAKEASEEKLQSVIKNSGNENLRQAAHNELQRREKEEHPQEEEKKTAESKKKTKEDSTAQSIETAFEQMAAGAKNAGVMSTFERFKKGDEIVFNNPVAVEAAKKSEFYNTEEQKDGSLKVLGVKNPDTGEWAGEEKDKSTKTVEDKSVQTLYDKLSDKSFRKLDRAKQYKLISESEKKSKEKGNKLEQNFSDKEIEAMDIYASHSYRDINDYLRGDLKDEDENSDYIKELKSTIADIDSIIDKHELKEDLVVYRGQDASHGENDNKAYKSTSLDPYTAYNFARGDKPEIKQYIIPKGTKYAYMGGGEKEVIFGRDLDMGKFQTEIKKSEDNDINENKGDYRKWL